MTKQPDAISANVSKSAGPAGLGAIFLIIFIDLVGFSIIFPLFPGMLDYYLSREGETGLLGWLLDFLNRFEQPGSGSGHFTAVLFGGVLGSIYSFLQFLFAPVWGSLSDRIGRRNILLLTTAGTAGSYLLWFFSGSFLLFVIARLIGGAMAGNLSVASAAIADVTTAEGRAKGMALVGIAFGLGFTLGPAIGGLLAMWNPLETWPDAGSWGLNPFSVPAAFAFLLATLNFVWVWLSFGETLPINKRRKTKGLGDRSPARMLQIRREAAPVRRTNLVYFIYIFVFSGMEFTLTFLATQRFAFTPRDIGFMFVHIGLVLIITQGLIVRKAVKHTGEKRMAAAGLALVLAAMFAIGFAGTVPALFAGLTLMAVGSGLINPSLTALVSLFARADRQGETLGIFRSLGSLGRAVGPLLASFVFWWFGSQVSYALAGVLMLIPLGICLLLPRPDQGAQGSNRPT